MNRSWIAAAVQSVAIRKGSEAVSVPTLLGLWAYLSDEGTRTVFGALEVCSSAHDQLIAKLR